MKKVKSLILLIKTLSRSEKKSIYLNSELTKGDKAYMELFKLIDKQKVEDSSLLFQLFTKKYPKASFHPEVKYLYDFILSTLVRIKTNQDKSFSLHQKILNARILKERNLDTDYHSLLKQLEKEAEEICNHHLLMVIRRMELDFLRTNSFCDISEKALLKKQHKTNDTLKTIRQIHEQSSLYELLLHRIEKTPLSYNDQRAFFNDLIVSEITLVSNLNRDVFEIQKLHQLFQAHYLSYIGDHRSALNSFIELDNLFNNNKVLWNNPPLYYVSVLEGILESLMGNELYDIMPYFIDRLKLISHSSVPFQTEVAAIELVYSIGINIKLNKYDKCLSIIDQYQLTLIQKIDLLTPFRYLQVSLYLSIAYLLNKKYTLARKQIVGIINSDSYTTFSLFKSIQLINLIIYYELGDHDYLSSQIRSIKRINKINKKESKFENLLFYFLGIDIIALNEKKQLDLKKKIEVEFTAIESISEEKQFYLFFDFKSWMLAHCKF